MQDRETIKRELLKLGEGYDYFLDEMIEVLEDGYILDHLIWDKKLIKFAVDRGAINYTIPFEDDLKNSRI